MVPILRFIPIHRFFLFFLKKEMVPFLRFIPIHRFFLFFLTKEIVFDPSFQTKSFVFRSFVSYRYFVSFLKKEMVPILRFIPNPLFLFKKRNGSDSSFQS